MVNLQGIQISAERDLHIQGAAVAIAGAMDQLSASSEHYRKGTHIGLTGLHKPGDCIHTRKTDTTAEQDTALVRSTLQAANVHIQASAVPGADGPVGGMLAMSGTRVDTPGTLTLKADTLALLTQSTQSDRSQTRHGSDLAWQKAKGEGTSDQTTHYNQFHVGTLATPVAQVQAGLGARDSIAALAQQPGMGWVQQISQDPQLGGKIDWQQVQEAHTSWNYSQQGLTPAAAAVLTVVVAYFTAGAASGWTASVGQAAAVGAGEGVALAGGGAFLTGTGATISGVVSGAVTAGVSALASQAAVSLVNNQGNLGKTLGDLGSSTSVKGLLTAIATGGVLGGLNLNPTGTPTTSGGAQLFVDQLGQNLKAGAARAVVGTAINGGSLQDNLAGALATAFIDTAAAQGANAIGDWTKSGVLNDFTNKVAHAMAGCAAGAARTGDASGCGAGALGGSMGELAAELYGTKIDTAEFASMISAIAAALAGMDATQINLASQAGANAATNNYVSHSRDAAIRVTVAKENARLTQQCEASGCTQAKLDAIDRQMAVLERVLTVQHKSAMTEQDAKQLAQAVTELLPLYGSGESLVQLVTGRSSITGEEASRFWAAVGVVPVAGAMVRKVGEPSLEALTKLLGRLDGALLGSAQDTADLWRGQRSKFGENGGIHSAVGNLEPGNSLSTSSPRNGSRTVIDQGQAPTCGPVSCGMVINTAGIEVDLVSIIYQSGVTSAGTTMPRLVKVLNENGLTTERITGATVEDIAAATAKGDPAIVRMTLDRGGHAIVVDGVTMRNGQQVVAIRDPAGGRQYFSPIDEFRANFSGEAAITKVIK